MLCKKIWGMGLLAVALSLVPASAAPLALGACIGLNTLACPGFIPSFSGSPGTFLVGTTVDFSSGGLDGPLAAAVFLNPNGTTLDFYYQFKNNLTSTQTIVQLINFHFKEFTTDVGTRKDGIGSFGAGATAVSFISSSSDPTYIARNPNAGDTDEDIVFDFGLGLPAGL